MKNKNSKKPSDHQSFYIKIPDGPQITSAEAHRSEQELLARYKAKGPRAQTLKPLAIFYSRVGDQEKAYQFLKLWMKHAKSREEMAESLLMSGQLAEQIHHYKDAMVFYKQGLNYKHDNRLISFFLNNNLAYCCNQLGAYEEAIGYCEAAIQFDQSRANVYKNFGVSLAGLERFVEAVQIWIKALHVDVSDSRALQLLENLMGKHGEQIRQALPQVDQDIEACRRAVASARTGRFADWARGLTLN